jgi:hypothetical protein
LNQLINKTNLIEKESWLIWIGREYGLDVREIYDTIYKSRLLEQLRLFLFLVDTAIENKEYIIYSGD